MKLLKKIAQEFKRVFEGDRCRFTKRCELYQVPKKCPNCKGIGKVPALRDWVAPGVSAGIINPTLIKCSKCNGFGVVKGVVCNNWRQRFPTFEKAHCGKYRSMEDEEKEEVNANR